MLSFRARGQRGITLIEIILVLAIVAAATVAIFVFSKKASVTAAVETEQRQIEDIVKTVDGLFATQPNFAALGTNGAEYLRSRASRSGLKFSTNAAGDPALLTGLGGGTGTLTLSVRTVALPTGLSAPNNAYRLAYNGLTADECVRLVTASYPVAYSVHVSQDVDDVGGVRLAERGQLAVSPDQIAENCAASSSPSAFLYFVPARAIAAASPPPPAPLARCNPVHETQQAACPAGQIGAVTQERDGACTGPGNSMVYTVWATTNDTCQAPVVTPPVVTPPSIPDNCATATFTQVLTCTSPQTGEIIQTRTLDSCTGAYTPWVTNSNSCLSPTPATCTPQTEEITLACPPGQTGDITQSRSSTCPTPSSPPVWSGYTAFSNTCRGNATCEPQRVSGPIPCGAGTYGPAAGERERFRACFNATTQAPGWSAWNVVTPNLGCSFCPATLTETNVQWIDRDLGCASGETGSNLLQVEQVQTRTVSYSCPTGTTSLPAPSTSAWSGWSDTGATGGTTNTCTPATCAGSPNETQWNPTTGTCPAGETGTNTWEREQLRTRTCTAGAWGSYGAWSNTGATRNMVYTCTPATCTGSATDTQWPTQTGTCPAGEAGTNTWEYEQTRSRVCNAGAWSSYGSWSNTGATRNPVYTCAPVTCAGSATNTQWLASSASCPASTWGTNTWEREQLQSRTCTAGTWGSYGGWSDTGATRNVSNTCINCGSASGTQVVWQPRSQACPSGQTGSHTWEEQRNQSRTGTYSCPAGTTSLPPPSWSGWVDGTWTGTTRNVVNTCAVVANGCWVTTASNWSNAGAGPVYQGYSWSYANYGSPAAPSAGNFYCQKLGNGNWDCGPGPLYNITDAQRATLVDSQLGPWNSHDQSAPCTIGDTWSQTMNEGFGLGSEGYENRECQACAPPATGHWQSMGSANGPEVSCTMANRYFEQWSNSSNAECHAVPDGGGNYKTACTGGTPAWATANSNQIIGAGGMLIGADPVLANSACTVGDRVDYVGCDGHSLSGTRVSESFECVP